MLTRNRLIAIAALACAGLLASDAAAAPDESYVVQNCGNQNYAPGASRPDTQDTEGKKCVNATVEAAVEVAGLSTTQTSGSIAVTDTFQSVQAETVGRKGCMIQNTYANSRPIYVFFGPIADATKAKSFILDATHGLQITCAIGGLGVVTSQISVTGTATDAFTVGLQ